MKTPTLALLLAYGISVAYTITTYANQDLVSTSAKDASVYFIAPLNNQTVSKEFKVKFGLTSMGIAPAGINIENTGHHHLLIDISESELPDFSKPLPSNENLIHFGKGQTETKLILEPGEHTLQLLLGNFVHLAHDPVVISEKIIIVVE